jgi:hypothetical protein
VRAGDVRPGAAERLCRAYPCARRPARPRLGFGQARAVCAQDPGGMGLVYHEPAVVLLRERGQCGERCPVAVHGEDRVRDDQSPAAARVVASNSSRARTLRWG